MRCRVNPWHLSSRFDPPAVRIADRHYSRETPGSPQFVAPGRNIVLITPEHNAVWVTRWPEYTQHAWPGAWECSCFRNESEGQYLSSSLIRSAVAATRFFMGGPPCQGMITFIDASKVRHKRDPGRCFVRAGIPRARPPTTKGGLIALQLLGADMPAPLPPGNSLFAFIDPAA